MHDPGSEIPIVFNNCISVKGAACHSGYYVQYLRRLLRDGRLTGMKLGQAWLIDKRTFETYLENANHTRDKRFGPKEFLLPFTKDYCGVVADMFRLKLYGRWSEKGNGCITSRLIKSKVDSRMASTQRVRVFSHDHAQKRNDY